MSPGRSSAWCLVALVLVTTSCRNPPTAPIDQPFDLRVGQGVHVSKSDLDLRFLRVASDSRCPRGAQCIQAGTAIVTMQGRILKGPPEPFDVPLPGNNEQGWRAYDGYRISLLRLEPVPEVNQPADTTAYVATLRVEKR